MSIVGTGIDIVECLRIAQMIERHGELFITRVYTDVEIEYCTTRKAATQHYAGRWAAKEAVLKALGTGWRRGIGWRDIEIRNDQHGAPIVKLRGGARHIMERAGIHTMHVSISHCRSFAVAYVVAEDEVKSRSI
jgi:holo-[acyl-carrier protein] synthase